MTKSQFCFVP